MGGGSWDVKDWTSYSTTHIKNAKTPAGMYTSSRIKPTLDPLQFRIREAMDSADHPQSTPIILGLDVSGSMDSILDAIARSLGDMMKDIITRQPVSDPQIAFMAIGDMAARDQAPVQMTQFESDIRIAEQMTEIYFERGGGGNNSESYIAAWYMAAYRTAIDSMAKRGKKGFIFTMGDEQPTPSLSKTGIKDYLGDVIEPTLLTNKQILQAASKDWEIFHLICIQGSHCRYGYEDRTVKEWRELLGERAMVVSDYTKIPQIIVSALEVLAGKDKQAVLASWDGTTAMAVGQAISGLRVGSQNQDIITF
jgi:hypothetical protein